MNFNNPKIKLNKKDLAKNIRFPTRMSVELAELIGIHLGDGSINKSCKSTYTISYTGNLKHDKEYMFYINELFKKIFNAKLSISINKKKNSYELRIRSKSLCQFMNIYLKLPFGRKTNLKIPSYIKNDPIYLKAFLKGLFDTDGCVTIQRQGKYAYSLVKICTKSKKFADEISTSFHSLNIPSFICKKRWKDFIGYDVVVRNRNIKKFFRIINSNNSRKIYKYHRILNKL